jgi:hypothetical protein
METTDGVTVIKLIKDGALPHPAKCIVCGYAGNERYYYWFKYKEKWGQVLICTTCMKEAATLDTQFVEYATVQEIIEVNHELRAENDRLELATERFTDKFAGLVTEFLADIGEVLPPIKEPEPEETSDSELSPHPPVEPIVEDGAVSVELDFAGTIPDDNPFGKF